MIFSIPIVLYSNVLFPFLILDYIDYVINSFIFFHFMFIHFSHSLLVYTLRVVSYVITLTYDTFDFMFVHFLIRYDFYTIHISTYAHYIVTLLHTSNKLHIHL